MKSILFICTGNIFRSLTAEYVLNKALNERIGLDYRVSSAGIEAKPQAMSPVVQRRLFERGINPFGHQQRKLNHEILTSADLAVAMGLDHQTFVRESFGQEIMLFNQICYGKEVPILDTWEAVPDWQANPTARRLHILSVVDYIFEVMPYFIENVDKFLAE